MLVLSDRINRIAIPRVRPVFRKNAAIQIIIEHLFTIHHFHNKSTQLSVLNAVSIVRQHSELAWKNIIEISHNEIQYKGKHALRFHNTRQNWSIQCPYELG